MDRIKLFQIFEILQAFSIKLILNAGFVAEKIFLRLKKNAVSLAFQCFSSFQLPLHDSDFSVPLLVYFLQ